MRAGCHQIMMDNLRKTTNHIIIKIILALVILSFIFTGVGNYLISTPEDYIAKVNDQIITRTQVEQLFQSERQHIQQQANDDVSMLDSHEDYMRQQILSQLIDNILLVQYAKKLGLGVSNEQIKNTIRKIPYFQKDGQFDKDQYLDLINRMGDTVDHFALLIREQLIIQQIYQAFIESNFILPAESKAMSSLILQQRNVRLAKIDLKKLEDKQSASEDELKNYYKQNQKSFISPEQIKISYILIDAAFMKEKIQVNDIDISTYYDQNKNNYSQSERKNYSVIQLKTKQEADGILVQLKKGGDFATLAQNKSIDIISRRTNGSLGWLEAENTPNELKKANLTEKGQLSGVIESSIGYFIVRLNDIEPEKIKSLKEVHDIIAKQIRKERGLDAYYALQQKVSEAVHSDNESLVSAEVASNIKAIQTGWFTRDNIPAELHFEPIIKWIFNNALVSNNSALRHNSDVITVEGDRAFVMRVSAYKAENIKSFDEVKDQVTKQLKHNKAITEAKLQGEQILTTLKHRKDIELMRNAHIVFGSQQKIMRTSEDNALIKAVFSLPYPKKDKTVYGISQDNQDNIVLIALDSVTPIVLSNDDMKIFIKNMQQDASNATFYSLLTNLRKYAKIKINNTEQYQP
ncbi:peptidyl-prolyl cis-trans isomerase D [Serratia symbiotica str. 'Cinara cedri']|nr:peptidyl-prolyl cis-trans isomerase D [Serratia symbiotica str. 'Cinara cedri']